MAGQITQQIEFINHALASLFHNTPESFLALLERDGTRLLRFYWDKAGQQVQPDERRDSFGLNYVLRAPRPSVIVTLITLPAPQIEGEAYFAALTYRPNRRMLLVSDTTSVIALEAVDPLRAPPRTVLVEWTRRLQREPLRKDIPANLEDFYTALLDEIRE